jgi:hypothetical protein
MEYHVLNQKHKYFVTNLTVQVVGLRWDRVAVTYLSRLATL